MAGWLKLHRKILDSRVFSDAGLLRLWLLLLCRANFKPSFFRGREIRVGQVAFTHRLLCDSLGVSKGTLHRDLDVLKIEGMIAVEAGRDFSIATICNWKTYQDSAGDDWGTDGAQAGHDGGADEPLPKKETIQEPPPPTPSATATPDRDAWEGVEDVLLSLGMSKARQAVQAAIDHRCSPADVGEVVEYYRSQPGAYDVGGLHNRILALRPGQSPGALWPDPKPSFARQRASVTSTVTVEAVKASNAQGRSIKAAHAARQAELEREFGATLDEMAGESLHELFLAAFGDDYQWKRHCGQGGEIGVLDRGPLLMALAGQETVA